MCLLAIAAFNERPALAAWRPADITADLQLERHHESRS